MAKTQTSVATQAMRAIPDDRVPSAVATGVARALLRSEDIVENMLEEAVASIGIRAERAYQYAKSGGYVFGLPSGKFTSPSSQAQTAVEQVLQGIHGAPVTLDYLHHGVANNLHVGWIELIANHGYNTATNQLGALTASLGTPVYLDDMVVMVPASQLDTLDKDSLQLWGKAARAGSTPERNLLTPTAQSLITHTPVATHAGSTEFVRVTYARYVAGVLTRNTFDIPITGFSSDSTYFQARYSVNGQDKYWIYRNGAGTHPSLDSLYDSAPEPGGSFFPFTYFRHNKQSVIQDKTTQEYKTSRRLLKHLGMDYDQLASAIDQNPDIADVEQAVLMFALPANTTVEIERAYLWTFFNNLFLSQDPANRFKSEQVANMGLASKVFNSLTSITPSVVIQDSRFKMSLNNSGIFKRSVVGKIAEVGQHSSTYDAANDYHCYMKQVSDNAYEEVQVKNLQTIFRVFEGWSVTADDQSKILLVPLDHSITQHYSVLDREVLYARSLHYVFNSRVVTKLKWYQTGIFRAVLLIVAIVVTIITWGSTLSAIWAALSAGAYSVAAYLALTLLIEYLIVTTAFKLFVKLVGVKFAFVAAVIAAIAGVVIAIEAGSLSGAPWASELLTISSNITSAVSNKTAEDFTDLFDQQKEFELLKEEKEELLDTAQQLLNRTTHLEPIVIFGEKPDDFYNRTVHSGNIGVAGIDAISVFVDMKLKLPKLAETMQEGGEYGYV